jgi:hypothetical protein
MCFIDVGILKVVWALATFNLRDFDSYLGTVSFLICSYSIQLV